MSESDVTSRETFSGVTVEIDGAGDYRVDTSDAIGGDVTIVLGDGRALNVEVGGRTVLQVTSSGGSMRVEIGGSGEQRMVLGDALKQFLDEFFQTKFDLHVHTTAMGPSGPPLPPFAGTSLPEATLSDIVRTKG